MLITYTYALLFAALAIVYTEVLTAPGNILGWLDKLIHRFIKSEYLLKPLGDCTYCFGGQVALWGYPLVMEEYWWLEHILFTSLAIFTIHIYKQIADKWN